MVFVGCSPVVDRILAPDVMKSVKHLVPDLLANLPVLLYQGGLTPPPPPPACLAAHYHASHHAQYECLDWFALPVHAWKAAPTY